MRSAREMTGEPAVPLQSVDATPNTGQPTRRLTTKYQWPGHVDALLRRVADDGFLFYLCGDRGDPAVLVAAYYWDRHVDLITITPPGRVTAVRAIREASFDPFAPRKVVWAYGNDPEPTLLAALNLPHPDHPDHPASSFEPPRLAVVPAHLQRPTTVKAPEPWRAGNRARRLEQALAQELATMREAGLVPDGGTALRAAVVVTNRTAGSSV
ncbi:hypothetical protein [Amycolatopsis sp. NPDC006125]|uniref:hypothetical protein n=1 Tax=Amycolatopsis sp. NPDC006125 TaxID=3156730 RepID=UPI00339FF7C0